MRLAPKSGKYRYEPIVGHKKNIFEGNCVGHLKTVKDDRILLFIGLVAVVSFLPKEFVCIGNSRVIWKFVFCSSKIFLEHSLLKGQCSL